MESWSMRFRPNEYRGFDLWGFDSAPLQSIQYYNNMDKEEAWTERYGTTPLESGSESTSRAKGSNTDEMPRFIVFSDKDIKDATNDFSKSKKIGQRETVSVYTGKLRDTEVSIKILNIQSVQELHQFIQELDFLGRIRHQNIVKLIGACFRVSSLVYEYLPNGNLEYLLNNSPQLLTWQKRTRIVFEICSALMFLHSNKPQPIVHGDPNPDNIVLDANFHGKLTNFCLPPFQMRSMSGMDLETGHDVYTFGVTILRILTGRSPARLVETVELARQSNSLLQILDYSAGHWPEHVAKRLASFGVKCCRPRWNCSRLMLKIWTELKETLAKIDDDRSSNLMVHSAKTFEDGMSSIIAFSYKDIENATNSFIESMKIGQWGNGSVYNGKLGDNKVAIKILDAHSMRGLDEFVQELDVIAQIRHQNVVKLIGACFQVCSLLYEYLPNGSLEDCLRNNPSLLAWKKRTRIVFEICSVLVFLHSNKPRPLVHGDLIPHNVLLDENFNSKISDSGLFHLLSDVSVNMMSFETLPLVETRFGTGMEWYIDPEYLETGLIGPGCDVYSFGVTVLRILTGRSPARLLSKVDRAVRKNTLLEIVDSAAGHWPVDVATLLADIGLSCCDLKRNNSKHLEKIWTCLKEIIDKIDIATEQHRTDEETEDVVESNIQDSVKKDDVESYDTTPGGQESESIPGKQASSSATLNIKLFTKYDIEAATDGLSDSSVIGEGGFGRVYKGFLDNTEVAIKVLKPNERLEPNSREGKKGKVVESNGRQGIDEFLQELESLGGIKHESFVNLIGVCFNLHCLVYELVPNGSLEDCLKNTPDLLTWQKRTRIVYEICLSLMFLRSNKPHCLVHGDIKPGNILLDVDFNPKLSDFGFCHLLPKGSTDETFIESKNIGGTEWYMDPDFLETGKLTLGCDVYSFGVTILRILTGKKPDFLVRMVYNKNEKKSLMTIVDPKAGQGPEDVVGCLANLALNCCDEDRNNSKLMTQISTCLKVILDDIGA